MIHDNSDHGRYRTPLGFSEGVPLDGLMTLHNFIQGGYEVTDAKILVIVKSFGAKKKSAWLISPVHCYDLFLANAV